MSTLACAVRFSDRTPRNTRLEEIRSNLKDRIIEAKREGWLGEVERLQISLSGATDKLAQIDRRSRTATIDLGLPLLNRRTGRINKCDNAVQTR